MKIIITGSDGQLGVELQNIIKSGKAELGYISERILQAELIPLNSLQLDITNMSEVEKVLLEEKPDVLINCAAFTNVDGCESQKDLAYKVNALGPRNLAIVCEKIGSKLVHISTDYIFDGKGKEPIKEYDLANPQSVYGKTKLVGESYVKEFCSRYFVIRTSWLYGYSGKNFVYTMMRLGNEKQEINVVNDQKGNPTNANDLGYHILKLIETTEYGVYHCTGNGECTWYEFAKEIMKIANCACNVNSCTSSEFKTVAKRPKYSSLDNMMLRCTIGDSMPNWKDSLKIFIHKVKGE
ncbi:MAG: dTDP-4-dehydrorhamnose reductase [Clostridium sp.]|nr:dTDP-4-dehydrorhamnose reductase [Clostridium sp.]